LKKKMGKYGDETLNSLENTGLGAGRDPGREEKNDFYYFLTGGGGGRAYEAPKRVGTFVRAPWGAKSKISLFQHA